MHWKFGTILAIPICFIYGNQFMFFTENGSLISKLRPFKEVYFCFIFILKVNFHKWSTQHFKLIKPNNCLNIARNKEISEVGAWMWRNAPYSSQSLGFDRPRAVIFRFIWSIYKQLCCDTVRGDRIKFLWRLSLPSMGKQKIVSLIIMCLFL